MTAILFIIIGTPIIWWVANRPKWAVRLDIVMITVALINLATSSFERNYVRMMWNLAALAFWTFILNMDLKRRSTERRKHAQHHH